MRQERAGIRALVRGKGRAIAAMALLPLMVGCETDSYLMDPSVLGRWEHTPTSVPILTRIASVEGPEDEFLEAADVQPSDLLPEVAEYRIGAGDILRVTLYDIPEEGRPNEVPALVDTRGYIDLPQLGQVYVGGLTATGAQQAIMERMREFVAQPLAFVMIESPRQQQITLLGAVQAPGRYTVPSSDYRLLDALAAAGGFSEAPNDIFVIRQLPLSPEAGAGRPTPAAGPSTAQPPQPSGEDLVDVIDRLTRPPEGQTPPPAPETPPSTPPQAPPPTPPQGEPQTPPPSGPGASPGVMRPKQPTGQPAGQPASAPIDLIPQGQPNQPPQQPQPRVEPETGDTTWVHLNGRWVRVKRPDGAMAPTGADVIPGAGSPVTQLVTQRVIRIPTRALANGDARYNIVVRPGDVIRVPPPPAGTIYVGGQIGRPGAFNLAENLTLQRVIIAAGGLTQIAVPERVDVVRMVGRDRQAIVRVNLRAIAEGTHPDIYLKQNDVVNIGTNFWATPLAVIRNGFRATYGFGFLVDRNFGSDIFGVPPDQEFN